MGVRRGLEKRGIRKPRSVCASAVYADNGFMMCSLERQNRKEISMAGFDLVAIEMICLASLVKTNLAIR